MQDSTADTAPKATRLAEYAPPAFLIDTVDLVFDLDDTATLVKSRLTMRRNPAVVDRAAPLRLDGDALELISIALDGEALGENRYRLAPDALTIAELPDEFVLDIETRTDPDGNTALSGLYRSGGNFCTQCEAEGFRRITYFLDRPDVMARYTTTILADKARYPVLLSNGNPTDRGDAAGGRHWAKWQDPHPKPSYLFALVAGDLVALEDRFVTRSGKTVPLAIWVGRGDEDKCGHAMQALKDSMRWDEERFGLEYDLDVFNIVAVGDFNMGAMENKGLNIFNTKYVLAAPLTATDTDYQGIERVIAHEYFHNWTGDRVTCRDWFQLSLKEGLTVFRDQEFMSDQHSRPVKRIADVELLRTKQFPEDAGPLAHPVRPDAYIEIDNFYTSTVYEKGAELVRMIHSLIGKENFRKGMDLYFQRHDNQAVTVDDFVVAMQDASGTELQSFKRWYVQAGTPELSIEDRYDPAARRYELTVTQHTAPTPGQAEKAPLVIPLAIGLIGPDGMELAARLDGDNEAKAGTRILAVTAARQTFGFDDVAARPVPSLLRGFSAPVKLADIPLERLKFLAAHDTDPFARWDAGQRVATHILLELVAAWRRGEALSLDPDLVDGFRRTLSSADADPALAVESLVLPGEVLLAEQMPVADVDAIHAARRFVRRELGIALAPEWAAAYDRLSDAGPYRVNSASMARRALRNTALAYLGAAKHATAVTRAQAQFDLRSNLTDVLAALGVLIDADDAAGTAALARFYEDWAKFDLVIDKWFALQAMTPLPATLDRVEALSRHPAYDIKNPNRVRALVGSFAQANPVSFHDASGRGYRFLADQVLALDPLNPQNAARQIQPLGAWRRYDTHRQALMKREIERVLAALDLSKNTYEMASKSLG